MIASLICANYVEDDELDALVETHPYGAWAWNHSYHDAQYSALVCDQPITRSLLFAERDYVRGAHPPFACSRSDDCKTDAVPCVGGCAEAFGASLEWFEGEGYHPDRCGWHPETRALEHGWACAARTYANGFNDLQLVPAAEVVHDLKLGRDKERRREAQAQIEKFRRMDRQGD